MKSFITNLKVAFDFRFQDITGTWCIEDADILLEDDLKLHKDFELVVKDVPDKISLLIFSESELDENQAIEIEEFFYERVEAALLSLNGGKSGYLSNEYEIIPVLN